MTFQIKYGLIFAIFDLACSISLHSLEGYHIQPEKKPHVPILKHEFKIHHQGYQYGYETGNGIHVQETGYIKNKGDKKHETLVQQGKITYHDEHGHPITLTYIADEHGFQPQGSHLPTAPPIPAVIAKTLTTEDVHEEVALQQDDEMYGAQQFPQY